MSSTSLTRYVVTFHYQENSLGDINKLTSTLTEAGFSATLNDDEGKVHELGTNSFGIVSTLEDREIREMAEGFGQIALGDRPEVEVLQWEAYRQRDK
ncbi:hypothetical protein ED28_00465 [[Pantoea] beijingensis]|uniref:Uncharacterized protein n=1 Tax=[Pantoea] beijingensis TaxID=1324864 RepID=A0A443IHK5_9GAMM|nr:MULTISPECIES: type V toxin-antitoxin system endoribonuclease antitoxin GhoS [Erwiniaceae]RWR03492.1 hypothetical protein ED28_00465 [[Pantoea] beijingensis]